MSVSIPKNCANSACRELAFKPIHSSTQRVAIDAVDGPPVFSHHVTYRCSSCGHTWAVQGYSSDNSCLPAAEPARELRMNTRAS